LIPLTPLLASALGAAIPLMFAALGELIAEKSGMLNLGLEGTMLMGALSSFIAVTEGCSLPLALLIGLLVSAIFTLLFAFVTITLQANQVASGLSLTILGLGLSAVMGRNYVGFAAAKSFTPEPIPLLSEIPLIGPTLFSLDYIAYFGIFSLCHCMVSYKNKIGVVTPCSRRIPIRCPDHCGITRH
jgi:simple sugar transport system permease protein